MLRNRLLQAVLLLPVLAVLGCGAKDKPPEKTDVETGKGEPTTSAPKTKEELASKGWGTLQGKVTFEGTPPTLAAIDMSKDQTGHCKKGPPSDTTEQLWRVGGADKGVGNVVVWLRAPKGKYFKIPDNLKEVKEPVTISQPFCAFEPHVVAVYASYYDPATKKQKPSGQKLRIINDAPIGHNTNLSFDNTIVNSGGFNKNMDPKTGEELVAVNASKATDIGGEQTFSIICNVHGWMNAKGRIFDHPFFAVTSGGKKDDKEFGAFKIDKAPAGVELELVCWHESMSAPKVLKKITLKDGETLTENFNVPK